MPEVHLTTILLPWFPIILAVGVGGRLLGRGRGVGLGIVCAIFWLLLVQASAPGALWGHGLTIASLAAGAVSIVAIGAWASEMAPGEDAEPGDLRAATSAGSSASSNTQHVDIARSLTDAIQCFREWFEEHRTEPDPWLSFDELIRSTLRQTCGARGVRPYRTLMESGELVPLGSREASQEAALLSARRGIVGHVVTSGRSYTAGDAMQGKLIDRLAHDTPHAPAWCFAIEQGTNRLGVVVIKEMDGLTHRPRSVLRAMEQLINLWWQALHEACIAREALVGDPVTGLHSREAFLHAADHALAVSYGRGEPVALAVIAVEHLRDLNDAGQWDAADALVTEIGAILRQRVRSDDALGRFDGSRFLVLLRRVDSELASLIVEQILSQMEAVCRDESRWGRELQLRCGLTGSGTAQPDARSLLTQALQHCTRARELNERYVADLAFDGVQTGAA